MRFIECSRLRRDLFIAEAREGIADKDLFVSEFEIHNI